METRILTLFDDEFFPPEPPKEKPKKEKAPKPAAAGNASETNEVKKDTDIIADALNEFHQKESKETGKTLPSQEEKENIKATPTEELNAAADPAAAERDETELLNANIHFEAASPSMEETYITPADVEYEITTGIDLSISDEAIYSDIYEDPEHIDLQISNDDIDAEALPNSAAYMSDEIIDEPQTIADNATEPIVEHVASIETEEEKDTEEDIITSMEEENDAVIVEQQIDDSTQNPVQLPAAKIDDELHNQMLNELIQLDYTALMHKQYPFDLNKASVINKELPKAKKTPVDKVITFKPEEPEAAEEDNEVFEDVTPLPEWQLNKKYYTIGEVANLFEVNTSHIRFWTSEFKLRPRTTRKGDRLYSPKDIAELRLIHHLVKVKKHTIKGAREKLKVEKTDVNNKLDLKESLIQLKDTLLKIREQL